MLNEFCEKSHINLLEMPHFIFKMIEQSIIDRKKLIKNINPPTEWEWKDINSSNDIFVSEFQWTIFLNLILMAAKKEIQICKTKSTAAHRLMLQNGIVPEILECRYREICMLWEVAMKSKYNESKNFEAFLCLQHAKQMLAEYSFDDSYWPLLHGKITVETWNLSIMPFMLEFQNDHLHLDDPFPNRIYHILTNVNFENKTFSDLSKELFVLQLLNPRHTFAMHIKKIRYKHIIIFFA